MIFSIAVKALLSTEAICQVNAANHARKLVRERQSSDGMVLPVPRSTGGAQGTSALWSIDAKHRVEDDMDNMPAEQLRRTENKKNQLLRDGRLQNGTAQQYPPSEDISQGCATNEDIVCYLVHPESDTMQEEVRVTQTCLPHELTNNLSQGDPLPGQANAIFYRKGCCSDPKDSIAERALGILAFAAEHHYSTEYHTILVETTHELEDVCQETNDDDLNHVSASRQLEPDMDICVHENWRSKGSKKSGSKKSESKKSGKGKGSSEQGTSSYKLKTIKQSELTDHQDMGALLPGSFVPGYDNAYLGYECQFLYKSSIMPSAVPSGAPSSAHSSMPSAVPSRAPSSAPSSMPSAVPSRAPSSAPSSMPSAVPSISPSVMPSSQAPSTTPSGMPSAAPTAASVGGACPSPTSETPQCMSLTAPAANLKGSTDFCYLNNCCMDNDCSWDGSITICECSCNGVGACSNVGYGTGRYIGPNACNGENACNSIAASYFGGLDSIGAGSCVGLEACRSMGVATSSVTVGADACNGGDTPCKNLRGVTSSLGTSVTIGEGSCKGTNACESLGFRTEVVTIGVDTETGSCIGTEACQYLGFNTIDPSVTVGSDACNYGEASCKNVRGAQTHPYGMGAVEIMAGSCKGDNACESVGFPSEPLTIGTNSCTTANSCFECGVAETGAFSIPANSPTCPAPV